MGAEPHIDALTEALEARARASTPVPVQGRITRAQGTVLHAILPDARIGEECFLRDPHSQTNMRAEVIGFSGDEVLLAPGGDMQGLSRRTQVIASGGLPLAPAGTALLGRVVDAFGAPLDGGRTISCTAPVHAASPGPLERPVIDSALTTGVRAIDGFLTLGHGQRIGLFGAAGVGKSRLLSQIIRGTDADRVVLGLIGERGREVREFLENDLGAEGLQKAAVIVATSDRPATERLRAAFAATAAAEAFRAQGHSTLLLLDSATRVARAIREIGLSAGEAPVRRGFPPSTFAVLPRLVERAGRTDAGSITAIYTVLVEGDDDDADPVADELRSLLDGHVILSRDLAAKSHFPAIDVQRSVSRLAGSVTDHPHQMAVGNARAWLAKLDEIELLVQVGEYSPGADPVADAALAAKPALDGFLRQDSTYFSSFAETRAMLADLA